MNHLQYWVVRELLMSNNSVWQQLSPQKKKTSPSLEIRLLNCYETFLIYFQLLQLNAWPLSIQVVIQYLPLSREVEFWNSAEMNSSLYR